MRAARTLLISAALLTAAAACSPRAFSVECVGAGWGVLPGECEHVADQVAPQVGLQQEGFGKLMVVSVAIVDCRAEGAAASNIDRCWHVVLDYESGSMSWLATRDRASGAIDVQQ